MHPIIKNKNRPIIIDFKFIARSQSWRRKINSKNNMGRTINVIGFVAIANPINKPINGNLYSDFEESVHNSRIANIPATKNEAHIDSTYKLLPSVNVSGVERKISAAHFPALSDPFAHLTKSLSNKPMININKTLIIA